MTAYSDPRLLELLSSKICHDLISPVGAVSNGVEILEELGPDAGDDVTGLISFSATQANAKLKAMRMAYGLGGSDSSIKIEDVHQIFGDFISGEKRLSHDWDPYADYGVENREGFCKILLCCLKFIADNLPRGGVISVNPGQESGELVISATGEGAVLSDDMKNAYDHKISIDNLTPKLVHSYVTGVLANHYGFVIHMNEGKDDFISLILKTTVVS